MMLWLFTLAMSLAVLVAGLVVLGVAYWFGGWRAAACIVAVGCAYVAICYMPHVFKARDSKSEGMTRIVFANVRIIETDIRVQAKELVSRQPDVIALVEVRREWDGLMKEDVFKDYPYHTVHRLAQPDGDDHALLLSRWPISHVSGPERDGERDAIYRVEAPVPFHVMVVHPTAPFYPQAVEWRNAFLKRLAAMPLPEKLVIVGDFNTVPWDTAMLPLWFRKDLKFALSWLPTYNALLPAVPIDHVMYTAGVDMQRVRRWFDGQSDHFGLIVDFRLRD